MAAAALILLTLLCSPAARAADTVVLADPRDPYYPLAQEIARQEGSRLVESREAALAASPVFLIWVVSPAHLPEQTLVDYGMAVRDRPSAISLGLITGSTLDAARSLWQRAPEANARRSTYADVRAEQITWLDAGETLPLTAANMQRAVRDSDYLLYSGHAGARSWMGLRSGEIPSLGPIVISTASCQTLRPWMRGNIALDFVDKGAAAYVGFPSSPAGPGHYMVGQMGGMPLRHTWPECPVGHVVQIEARGAMQTFARFPQYFLLGDPRISFRAEAPYRVVEDSGGDAARVIRLADAEPGVMPVRIPGGAAYDFISVSGLTEASSHDLLFNSRLQMANIGEDKLLLLAPPGGDIAHQGGDLRIELRAAPPWHWPVSDTVLDFLDLGVITGPSDAQLALVAALVMLALAGWKAFRRRAPLRLAALAALAGVTLATVWLAYVLLRRESVTVTAAAVEIDPLYSAAGAMLIGCALFLFLIARSRWALLPAVFFAQFPGSLVLLTAPIGLTLKSLVANEPPYYSHLALIAQALRVLLACAFLAGVFAYIKKQLAPRFTPQG
jgi:hypothetical protein